MCRFSLISIIAFLLCPCATLWSTAVIDKDVTLQCKAAYADILTPHPLATLVFVSSLDKQDAVLALLAQIPGIQAKKVESVPALLVFMPPIMERLYQVATVPDVARISTIYESSAEMENSAQAILLRPSYYHVNVDNWWRHGFTGQAGVLGLIDFGVATEHPSLSQKNLIIRKEPGSGYSDAKNGVEAPHATGVACIYMGEGSKEYPNDQGLAYGAETIVAGLAGDKRDFDSISRSFGTLDWMLKRVLPQPTVINYSVGNGPAGCAVCPDWSGLAAVVDYVVNKYKILWVKSAGNFGYIDLSEQAPFRSTLSVPADNFNGLTVANMNPELVENGKWMLSPDRVKHTIRFTSSRGPTVSGRKKPDISAPGNDTRTCAPDPKTYLFEYTPVMDFHDGYRLMGGTSSAAPHVGGSILLLESAGIREPMVQKALLINSADAWTDSGHPGPDTPSQPYAGDHHPVEGSEWNRTYGWGYLNMQTAFEQRNNVLLSSLSPQKKEQVFEVALPVGAKVTLVHERRVGFDSEMRPWGLSHLSLELIDAETKEVLAIDNSAIDTVHQVAHCIRNSAEDRCAGKAILHALVKVSLKTTVLEGAVEEPFALVMTVPFKPLQALS